MKGCTIYTANCTGNAKNCIYPTEVSVKDIASLKRAMRRDHVCAMYHDRKRSAAGFEWSDCIPMDCDNDYSEAPAQRKQPEDVVAVFPDVTFAVCYSRNRMKEKNGRAACPKFHCCYFPVEKIVDSKLYAAMKHQIQRQFPWFDANALDAARFYFGTEQPEVMFFEATKRWIKSYLRRSPKVATMQHCLKRQANSSSDILKDFGRSIGRAEEAAFISGDGVDAPLGFLKDAVSTTTFC